MRLPPLALGLCAWTAGITVPALYGGVIALAAAVSKQPNNTSFDPVDLMGCINQVPGTIWMYSLAMAAVGFVLVLAGFQKRKPVVDEELTV